MQRRKEEAGVPKAERLARSSAQREQGTPDEGPDASFQTDKPARYRFRNK